MTDSSSPDLGQALRRAAVRATLAASVHNSQPWRFVLDDDTLEIHADFGRQLPVLDPAGRQLMISCGCALLNARVSLAATGYRPRVQRQPDPARPALVARLTLCGTGDPEPTDPHPAGAVGPVTGSGDQLSLLAALDAAVELRRVTRGRFVCDPVPEALLDALGRAALAEAAVLEPIRSPEDIALALALSRRAERQQNADPAYRAERTAWTLDRADGREGLSPPAGPQTTRPADPEAPSADVGRGVTDERAADARPNQSPCLLLLGSGADDALAWIRAGEGLQRVLLENTRRGFSASAPTQGLEIAAAREALRRRLRLAMHPHILLRVGRAAPSPAPRRRRLVDMLSDSG